MQVDAAMTRMVVTVAPDAALDEAAVLMQRGRFRHLPVVEGSRLVGMVSERDVRMPAGVHAELARMITERTVREVMRTAIITVAPDDPIEQAAHLLYENKIGSLPVLADGKLAGIITTTDIFRAFVHMAGMLDPSTRVEIRTTDLPSALTAIAEVARREQVRIAGLVTERDDAPGGRRVVVRFATLQGPRVVAALKACGMDVVGPDIDVKG